ncbi:MAG: carboxypeptidase-like regulatory domain-containing protein [Kofleriaceae bacterium]
MAWIEGRLIDESGSQVAGVTVYCGPHIDARSHDLSGTVITNEDGVFRFDGLIEGSYSLSAMHGSALAGGTVPTNQNSHLVLKQLELTKLTVRDADGPIANARVSFGSWFETTTDANGQAMAPRTGFLKVSAPGYAFQRSPARLGPEHQMVLLRGSMIRGTVVDPLGQPVSNAIVTISGWSGKNVRADVHGRWEALIGAGTYKITARSILDVDGTPLVVDHDGVIERDGIVIHTRWAATLCISIVDREQRPVPGAKIYLSPMVGVRIRWSFANGSGVRVERLLVPGAYSVCATTDREASALFGIEIGEGINEVTLVVEPDRAIAGRVVDVDGNPVGGCALRSSGKMQHEAVTDDEGRFDLGGHEPSEAPNGQHKIMIEDSPSHAFADAVPGTMDLTIVMKSR